MQRRQVLKCSAAACSLTALAPFVGGPDVLILRDGESVVGRTFRAPQRVVVAGKGCTIERCVFIGHTQGTPAIEVGGDCRTAYCEFVSSDAGLAALRRLGAGA
jgi:hypothetical protein